VAREFLGAEGATGVELKTKDVERSIEIASQVEQKLGNSVVVLDWQELNRSLFYALKLEKIAMFVVLTFIILVASFSIVAMLIMIVIEKGREIALLKAIGATDAAIMRTFIFQGTVIGAVGAVIGLGLGLLICWLLETVGFPLNSDVYYISTLPVAVEVDEVVGVVVAAVGISMLATIYPSWQAARLRPVDGLRDE
jgi:lipoprotein-releasing system permease protein